MTRLWKRQARWRARSVSGRSGRFRARRPAPILISGEIANMPAMLRRTSASCRAGSVSRSARSANAIACSLSPAMCSAIAVVATISPRCGWWAGAIASARRPNCAAVPESVVTNASAASSSVAIATSSPTSALAASCAATSTGNAPASSRTTAAWRSSARRAVTGTLARTASRVMSCQNASFSSRSTSRFASSSSPTGPSRSEAVRPSVRASSSNVKVRPSEAATVTASLASSESRPSRSRIFSWTRRGSRLSISLGAAVDDADPVLFLESEERLDDEERATVGFRQLLQDRLIGLRAEYSAANCTTASSSSGPREIERAPSCFSCSSACTSGVASRGGRSAITQAIGNPMSRIGSVRIAATVPASAQWASSTEIRSGDSSAARSSSCCRSRSSQKRCSGCA